MPKVAQRAPVLEPLLVIVKGPRPSHPLLFYTVGPVWYCTENRNENGMFRARVFGVRRLGWLDGARFGWEGWSRLQLEVCSWGKGRKQREFTVRPEVDG